MKKILSLFLALYAGNLISMAQTPGDTLHIAGHDNVHMNWYGNYDADVNFPSSGDTYRQILMKFTLSCPSGGCSDWDYDVEIYKRHDTGILDSNLVMYPDFQVDGATVDSILYNTDTTYVTFFDDDNNSTDSTINSAMIEIYGDSLNPETQTDSMLVYLGGYYNYYYDTAGVATDSAWVGSTNQMNVEYYEQYNYFNKMINIELGRIVTPYANGLTSTWNREYFFDITDYASLLEDEQTIRAKYSGWSDGFTVTLDYYFIYGTPVRTVEEVHPLWAGYFAFGKWEDGVHTIENNVSEYSFDKGNATHAKLRFRPSGHGNAVQSCAEFCAKYYDVEVNGSDEFQEYIWREECGSNAQYPQPGTWLYDRANWCPGELVPVFEHEIGEFLVNGTNTIDVDFEEYTNSSNDGAGYNIAADLITYGDWNFNNNVAMDDILSPTTKFDHSRYNPICGRPEIVIQNKGGDNLTSCTIEYGIQGVVSATYEWTGNLAPLEKKEITLPKLAPWEFAQEVNNTFYAKAVNPNGQADEDDTDNELTTPYEIAQDFPSEFRFKMKTNNKGFHNNWSIKDAATGSTLYSGSNLDNNTTYEENISLDPGCYVFRMNDTGKDGMKFWANGDGTGYLKFIQMDSPAPVRTFNADFGTFVQYNFTVGTVLSVQEEIAEEIKITPNPSNGLFHIQASLNSEKNTRIEIYNTIGELVYDSEVFGSELQHTVDISKNANGVYFVKVISGKLISTQKIVKY
jgi:hypothetical protein